MASLASMGQQLPLVVVRSEEANRYVLVDGYKRVRALRLAGLESLYGYSRSQVPYSFRALHSSSLRERPLRSGEKGTVKTASLETVCCWASWVASIEGVVDLFRSRWAPDVDAVRSSFEHWRVEGGVVIMVPKCANEFFDVPVHQV